MNLYIVERGGISQRKSRPLTMCPAKYAPVILA